MPEWLPGRVQHQMSAPERLLDVFDTLLAASPVVIYTRRKAECKENAAFNFGKEAAYREHYGVPQPPKPRHLHAV